MSGDGGLVCGIRSVGGVGCGLAVGSSEQGVDMVDVNQVGV